MAEPKQRILHVIKRLDVVGGAERIVSDLTRCMPNHDVMIYDGDGSFFEVGNGRIIQTRSALGALWYCIRKRKKYSIFHLHLFPSIYFALLLGKKAIVHEHNTHNRRRDFFIFKPIEWMIYRRAKNVIAISEAAKVSLQNWVGNLPRVHVLGNFISPSANSSIPFRRVGDHKHILMVASFTKQKRQELLIEAFATLPKDTFLSFAGDGPRMSECKALAEKLCVANRIKFLGEVSDMNLIYSQADLCVLISNWEGFGLVVLEAAQLGIPTVVSDVAGLRDICPDNNLLFVGDAPEHLGKQIQRILSGQTKVTSGKELRSYAKKFSIDSYVKNLAKIYES